MMMHEDALAGAEITHLRAHFLHYSYWLMSQHQRCFAPDIPGHDIARTNTACARAHQHIVGTDFRTGVVFDANIAEVIKACDFHCHHQNSVVDGPGCQPARLHHGSGRFCRARNLYL